MVTKKDVAEADTTNMVKGNKATTDVLLREFPPSAIKERDGGREKLKYIEGHSAILRLIEATDNTFDVTVREMQYKPWGKTKNGEERILVSAIVALTIPGLGTREGLGVQIVTVTGGEDLVKGVVTDGLKKAASIFGMASHLYGENYENPTVRPDRKQFAELLKTAGITSIEALDKAAKLRYNVERGKDLTDAQVSEWMAELQGTNAPPF